MFYKDIIRNATTLWKESPSLRVNVVNVWKVDENNFPIFPKEWFSIKEDPAYINEEDKGKLLHFSNFSYIISFEIFETKESPIWLVKYIGLLQTQSIQVETYNTLSGKRIYRQIEYPDSQRTEYAFYKDNGEVYKWGFEDPYTKADYMITETGETVEIL